MFWGDRFPVPGDIETTFCLSECCSHGSKKEDANERQRCVPFHHALITEWIKLPSVSRKLSDSVLLAFLGYRSGTRATALAVALVPDIAPGMKAHGQRWPASV